MTPSSSPVRASSSSLLPGGGTRRRYVPPRAILGLAACAVLYLIIIWDDVSDGDDDAHALRLGPGGNIEQQRRLLAFLDPVEQRPVPYGRDMVDQNYQSLSWPTSIDSSMFRKQSPKDFQSSSDPSSSPCDDVLLFLPYPFSHNGHGSQINSFILASLISTYTNRAMVVLEPPNDINGFKSNSQFGCPPEAWRTEVRRKGSPPVKVGWNDDFPVGLNRLIRHPAWLSRGCGVPCFGEYTYEMWDGIRTSNNATANPGSPPPEVMCGGTSKSTNVVVLGGQELRDYFDLYYKARMLDRTTDVAVNAAYEWVTRMGARPHEAEVFVNSSLLEDRVETWDYASALLARSGAVRFQPWIGRDVEAYMKSYLPDLDLRTPYDAVHVRRGDKLIMEARRLVRHYWIERGMYDEVNDVMPTNYIPFRHYLTQYENVTSCNADIGPRTVYVATDDPDVVRAEIDDLTKDEYGNVVLHGPDGSVICHSFRFVLTKHEASTGHHLHEGYGKGSCEERYERNIASIADLMLLSRGNVVIIEYNSNWGRLVRTFRLRINDSKRVMNGARAVSQKGEIRVAWGRKLPGPPGW